MILKESPFRIVVALVELLAGPCAREDGNGRQLQKRSIGQLDPNNFSPQSFIANGFELSLSLVHRKHFHRIEYGSLRGALQVKTSDGKRVAVVAVLTHRPDRVFNRR
jgi:hypothetical protein